MSSTKGFKVSTQGIKQDLSIADGEFGSTDLGEMGPDQLIQLLQRVAPLRTPPGEVGSEVCPATVFVETDSDTWSFEPVGGSLINQNTGATVSVFDAVSLVTGASSRADVVAKAPAGAGATPLLAWGSDHHDLKGLKPVRKPDLLPTDRGSVEAATIDTSPRAPQFSITVGALGAAGGAPVICLAIGLLAAVLTLGMFVNGDTVPGVVCLAVTGFFFWLRGVFAGKARVSFRLGFDWGTNTLWAIRDGEEKPSWLGNATCVTDFSSQEEQYAAKRRIGGPMGGRSGMMTVTESRYQLIVHKTDGSAIPLCEFATADELREATGKAKALLSAQG